MNMANPEAAKGKLGSHPARGVPCSRDLERRRVRMSRQKRADPKRKPLESAAPNCYRHSRMAGSRTHADKFPADTQARDRPGQTAARPCFLRRSKVETADGAGRPSENTGGLSAVRWRQAMS